MWKLEDDKELLETFRKLGIVPAGKAVSYPPDKAPRIPMKDVSTEALLYALRFMGSSVTQWIVDELRRRNALPDDESDHRKRRKAG